MSNFQLKEAISLHRSGQLAKAAVIYQQLLVNQPKHQDALHLLGVLLTQQGQPQRAIPLIQQAINVNNKIAMFHISLGNALRDLGHGNAAIEAFQRAIQLDKMLVDAHYNLGFTYQMMNKKQEAADAYNEAIRIQPDNINSLNNLGIIECDLQNYDSSIKHLKRAIEIAPGFTLAWLQLGNTLRVCGQTDEALTKYKKVLEIEPDNVNALYNLGVLNQETGNHDESIQYYSKVIHLQPGHHLSHVNLSLLLLSKGDFLQGWEEYAWRYQSKGYLADHPLNTLSLNKWTGEEIIDGKLYIHAEQGIGDEILFNTCLHEILHSEFSCTVECDARLLPAMRRSFPSLKFIDRHLTLEEKKKTILSHTHHIACGDLSRFFRKSIDSFPETCDFLKADEEKVAYWREQCKLLKRPLNIGVVWRGGTQHTAASQRSMKLATLLDALKETEAACVSLQHGDIESDLQELNDTQLRQFHHWQEAADDIDTLLALIASVDIVVGVCTSAINFAGAMNKPTIVLLPTIAPWQFLSHGDHMPWFPSVNIIRQEKPGDWQDVCDKIVPLIARLTASMA